MSFAALKVYVGLKYTDPGYTCDLQCEFCVVATEKSLMKLKMLWLEQLFEI